KAGTAGRRIHPRAHDRDRLEEPDVYRRSRQRPTHAAVDPEGHEAGLDRDAAEPVESGFSRTALLEPVESGFSRTSLHDEVSCPCRKSCSSASPPPPCVCSPCTTAQSRRRPSHQRRAPRNPQIRSPARGCPTPLPG